MNWGDLTIGKKIAFGFGIVIILLIALGYLSFSGVGSIVKNASEVIEGKALDGQMAQKEVDHLNWIGEVNALLTDASITQLDVQTDHTKCAFGKWLYGPERKAAEKLIPSLAPLFREIEKPHKHLHDSAIEIKDVFSPADPHLPGFIAEKISDHLSWASSIQHAILENEKHIDVQTDHTLCAFGKWLHSDAARKAASADAKLSAILENIKAPHKRLHDSAKKIQQVYRQIHPGLDSIFHQRLDDHRKWAASVAHSLIADKPVTVEMDPDQCGLGKWLNSPEVKTTLAADPWYRKFLSRIKAPHEALHDTASAINRAIRNNNPAQARKIFSNETQKHLGTVSDLITEAIDHENTLLAGRNEAIRILKKESFVELEKTKDLLEQLKTRAEDRLNGYYQAAEIYADKTTPNLKIVQELLNRLRGEVENNMLTDEAMLKAASATKRNVAIIAAIAIVAGLLLSFVIATGIIKALNRITHGLSEGADQVASAASEVSSSSQAIAAGASQQAASIEETSASMEEMSSMTRRNAQNASHADGLMREANATVNQANHSMTELTRSMDEISKASDETSKIIKTIDEIAFQTNLLALNAAVEAARAGEAGAGFAVVADEVRNLAIRAAEAAKNTAELIDGTVSKISTGTQIVASTNESFHNVAESSEKVGSLIGEISEASDEQSKGIEQVNVAVSEMDKIVQQNAASAEETASASEEMNAQAEQLKDYVMDLVRMVQGDKGRTSGPDRRRQISGKQVTSISSGRTLPGPAKSHATHKLTIRSKEIRPDQVIPFDDDDFKDF